MSRAIAEQSSALSIFWLKRHGYLEKDCSYRYGGITWTHGYNDNKSNISFAVRMDYGCTFKEESYVELIYTHTNYWTSEKSSMNLKIPLTTTPCNYGGMRYWFICPLFKNGRYCGRRVGVLYSIGKYFGCRHCGDIAYAVQMRGGQFRGCSITFPEIDKLKEEVKREYYNGKPTIKYRRVLAMEYKICCELEKLVIKYS